MTAATVTETIAKIERTSLGFEDHGILTAYLHVSYGTARQGVGGYDLRPDALPAAVWIARVLEACGVREWEKLAGRTIYVLLDESRRPVGIAPLPTEPGRQFLFAEMAADAADGAS